MATVSGTRGRLVAIINHACDSGNGNALLLHLKQIIERDSNWEPDDDDGEDTYGDDFDDESYVGDDEDMYEDDEYAEDDGDEDEDEDGDEDEDESDGDDESLFDIIFGDD